MRAKTTMMKKMQTLCNCLVISVLLFICCCCSRQKAVDDIIAQAENIVEQQPDSALRLLNSVLFPEDLNKNLFNKYNLLLLQTKDKNIKDITSDTLIFKVKDYYVRKKDYPNAALAAFYCGRLWQEQENMDSAIEAYVEAENLADKTDNYNLKGLIQGNLGILHREHSSYEKSIEFYKNSVQMFDKAKNYRNKINTMRSIGDCFLLSKNNDSASYYYDESLKLAIFYNMPELQSDIKQSMGVAYREQGLYEKAKILFNEALNFQSDSIEQARILLNIAQMYILENNTDSVKLYLDKAIALQISDPWLMRTTCLLKSKIEEKNKRYQEALLYYKDYYQYTIKVFDSEKNNKLLEIQEKYDYEKLKNSQNQLIVKQQKIAIILSLVLLATCIIIFIYYRKSVKNRRLLSDFEQKVDSLEKMAEKFKTENYSFRSFLLDHFNILRKAALIKNMFSEGEQVNGGKMLKKFNEIVYGSDLVEWNVIFPVMDGLKDGFYSKIRAKYPKLNEMEFRICCLSCETNLSDKEIAIILITSDNMVRKYRSRARKRIGLFNKEDLLIFFENNV